MKALKKVKNIHFLLIYPLHTAPSQRFRFEQFFPILDEAGYQRSVNCFYDSKTFSLLYRKSGRLQLAFRMLLCLLRRLGHILTIGRYDCVLIQRGAAPFGPPVLEWVIKFVFRKPIIYDFDDAIWMQPERKISAMQRMIKSYSKVGKICRWSHTTVVGNEYLADFARRYAGHVVVIPTVVDTGHRFVPAVTTEIKSQPVIGWTGSHTTLAYLESLEPVLKALQDKFDFELLVMANKPPQLPTMKFNYVPWSEESEVEALQKIDIGIMPLPDDEWTKGKCGFKAIQYMALAKPAVASAVGVNKDIITDGVNGFLAETPEEWEEKLTWLLEHPEETKSMGIAARIRIDERYSLRKAGAAWLDVLASV
jgi:glycosyltransferase involved in cell wall biosynthesis